MLIVQGGNNGSNDFCLPNFLRMKFDYPTTRYSTPTPSITHYSTPTPMDGRLANGQGSNLMKVNQRPHFHRCNDSKEK